MGVTIIFPSLLLCGNRHQHVLDLDHEKTLLEKCYYIHCKVDKISFNSNNSMELS